jgi:DNA-directed RNA polymerase specialized sigma24 family protein
MRIGSGRRRNADLFTLGAIVAEAVERRRDGQPPGAEEYCRRYPHLRSEIEAHFETIALLESPLAAPLWAAADLGLKSRFASLPADMQRLIALRESEQRPWEEIARLLGRPEMELRRAYAGVIASLIEEAPRAGSERTR